MVSLSLSAKCLCVVINEVASEQSSSTMHNCLGKYRCFVTSDTEYVVVLKNVLFFYFTIYIV